MFPVFATIAAAAGNAVALARARPLLLLCGLVAYAVAGITNAVLLPRLHLGSWTAAHLAGWGGGLLALVLIAPVWTAVNRFVIVKDTTRPYLKWDVRVRRMLVVTLVLSLAAMIGGLPFAFSLDFGSRMEGRRSIALIVLLAASLWKLGAFWLTARLAIAPAMAAAGTRKEALDTAFAYTPGATFRILGMRLLIYLPAMIVVGCLMLLGRMMQADLVGQAWAVAAVTLMTAATELVDMVAMALVAVRLIKLRTSMAAGGMGAAGLAASG